MCKYFLQGHCMFGSSCRYSHDVPTSNEPEASQSTSATVSNTLCEAGSSVHETQTLWRPVPCRYFAAGERKNGAACRFYHGDSSDTANNMSCDCVSYFPSLSSLDRVQN